jgi:hypothetical protein
VLKTELSAEWRTDEHRAAVGGVVAPREALELNLEILERANVAALVSEELGVLKYQLAHMPQSVVTLPVQQA